MKPYDHYAHTAAKFGPVIFERLYALLPETSWDRREEGRFTPREVIAHLVDWEPIFRDRIRAAIREDMAPVDSIDEEELAKKHDYANQSVETNLHRFREERQETVDLVLSLEPEQRRRQYVHSEMGPISIADTLAVIGHHDAYHVEQITAFLGAKGEKVVGTW